jgi:hypothetical protein
MTASSSIASALLTHGLAAAEKPSPSLPCDATTTEVTR